MLGSNIKKIRKEKGWSQRDLANKIDSDASYINRLETGKLNPSISAMERIANAMDCTLDQLVKGDLDSAEIHIKDKNFSEKIRLIDSMDEDDKQAVTHIIDALLTKKRIRELLEGSQLSR
jgi:transcriptional regulator with XRE-family HTH domain